MKKKTVKPLKRALSKNEMGGELNGRTLYN
jgi:hypothetical protein